MDPLCLKEDSFCTPLPPAPVTSPPFLLYFVKTGLPQELVYLESSSAAPSCDRDLITSRDYSALCSVGAQPKVV